MSDDAKLFELADPIKVGEQTVNTLTLRAPTAGDLIEAQAEAERAVMTPDGYQLLVSHSMLAVHVLRRQIVRIGADSGPVDLHLLKRLSTRDFDALNAQAEGLDTAVGREIEQRGRADGAGGQRTDG